MTLQADVINFTNNTDPDITHSVDGGESIAYGDQGYSSKDSKLPRAVVD